MEIDIITSTLYATMTQYIVTEPITGASVVYQATLTTGDVIIGAMLMALTVAALYFSIATAIRGRNV